MEEREIDLLDMILEILSHWRGLLVAMLIGAFLMGAFSYMQSTQSVKNAEVISQDEMNREEQIQQLEETLSETQKVSVLTVIDDETEYALKAEYCENSIIMNMEPFEVSRKDLLYQIRVEDMGQSYMLGNIYEDLIYNVDFYEWIEQQTGISAISARELITVDAKSAMTILNGVQEATTGNDTMKVIILHANEKECEKLATALKLYIQNRQEELVQEVGAHELVLLSESVGTVMDTAIVDKQVTYNNTMITLITNIAKAKDTFTDDQMLYYNLLTQADELEEVEVDVETEEQPVVATPSVSLKYVLFGAIVFPFVYAGILLVIYILNGKLRASDELSRLYCISQMGVVVKDSKKKFFIDKWIEVLRNRGKRQFTVEQSLALATSAVKIAAMKNGLDNICLMGCNLEAGAGAICDGIKTALQKEQIEVTVLDNVLYDAVAMEKLDVVKGVVLVEKAGSTLYNEVAKELELLARQDITVLGGIVVE